MRNEVLAPDAKLIVPEASMDVGGVEEVVGRVSQSVADQVSVHHGHRPETSDHQPCPRFQRRVVIFVDVARRP